MCVLERKVGQALAPVDKGLPGSGKGCAEGEGLQTVIEGSLFRSGAEGILGKEWV